jgi:hypothetical protein
MTRNQMTMRPNDMRPNDPTTIRPRDQMTSPMPCNLMTRDQARATKRPRDQMILRPNNPTTIRPRDQMTMRPNDMRLNDPRPNDTRPNILDSRKLPGFCWTVSIFKIFFQNLLYFHTNWPIFKGLSTNFNLHSIQIGYAGNWSSYQCKNVQ